MNCRCENYFLMKLLLVFVFMLHLYTAFPTDKNINTNGAQNSISEATEANAVKELLNRLIPSRADDFLIKINYSLGTENKDTFKIENSENNKILIAGSRGYSAAFGLQYYLKYYCGCHISWSGSQLKIPKILPRVSSAIEITSNDQYRYYFNVCTFSYSTVWWDWERWQKELDYMALNGINLPLAFTGQEAIWKKVFKSFNVSAQGIDEFFTGPAFLAWNRMGNVQAWAGPLPDNWLNQQVELQHKILNRMKSFGMTPVYPAFSGRVPSDMRRIFPNASITYLDKNWGHFDPPYSNVPFLQPTDELFRRISIEFLNQYIKEFGESTMFNTDLFNEMPPPSTEPEYLAACAKAVYESLITVQPNATWIAQGWMFFSDEDIWTYERAKAFLTSVPIGKMIILDLQAELYPQYKRLDSFFGQPFIWCMLHNYGGVLGLYGSLEAINRGMFEAKKFPNSSMIGTGLTPEGIETNDIVYELMNEMGWRKKPVSMSDWISCYNVRRYGNCSLLVEKAWPLLLSSVYNATVPYRNHGKYILILRPSFKLTPYVWYDPKNVLEAWKFYVTASVNDNVINSDLFKRDLVDITRQSLQLMMDEYYANLKVSYRKKNIEGFNKALNSILNLYDDLEEILASDKLFLLGQWLENAKSKATFLMEQVLFEYNARNQITLWGPSGQILEYANKQWSGLMSSYYKKRWIEFGKIVLNCLQSSTPFQQKKFNNYVLDNVETPFTLGEEIYPTEPKGDTIEIAHRLYVKYMTTNNSLECIVEK